MARPRHPPGASHASGRSPHSACTSARYGAIQSISGASRCPLLNSTTAPPGSIISSSRRSVSTRSIQWNERPIVTSRNRPSAGDRSKELPRTKLMRPRRRTPPRRSAASPVRGPWRPPRPPPRANAPASIPGPQPRSSTRCSRASAGEPRHVADQPRRIGRAPSQIMLRRRAEATRLEKLGIRHNSFTPRPQCATIWCQRHHVGRTEPGHDRTPEGTLNEADHRPGRRRPQHPDQRRDDPGAGGFPGPHLHRRRKRPAGPERPPGRPRRARHQDAADGRHGAAAAAAPAQLACR